MKEDRNKGFILEKNSTIEDLLDLFFEQGFLVTKIHYKSMDKKSRTKNYKLEIIKE